MLTPHTESLFRRILSPGEFSAFRFRLDEPLVVSAKLRDATGDARLRLVKPNGKVIRMGDTIRKPLQPGVYRISVKNHDETDVSCKLRLQAARGTELDAPARLTPYVYSGTDIALDWIDTTNAERGCRIQRSTDGGEYETIATTKRNVTTALISQLELSTKYQFRIRAIGDNKTFSSEMIESPTVVTTSENLTGWYKVTSLDYRGKGEAGYSIDNDLTLDNDGWIYGGSWQAAVRSYVGSQYVGQVKGSVTIDDTDANYPFATSGAFTVADAAYLDANMPDFDISPDAGKLIVLEDSFETTEIDRDYDDFYWKVDVSGPLNFKLKEIEYTAVNPTQIYTVLEDGLASQYSGPHWEDFDLDGSPETQYPVAYRRAAKMKVTAKFEIDSPDEERPSAGEIGVTGQGPSNFSFLAKEGELNSTVSVNGDTLTITDEASSAFADYIEHFDTFNVNWWISLDGQSHSIGAGTSANQVYVTLDVPTTPLYHTLVHLATKNARTKNTVADATTAIWNEFTDRSVTTAALPGDTGTQLTYYANYLTNNSTTASLLTSGDGQCGAWTRFFIDMLKSQGIENTNDYMTLAPLGTASGFIMRDWYFVEPGSSGILNYPYYNVSYRTTSDWREVKTSSGYDWKFAEVMDVDGSPGQGTTNPLSMFTNHQVVKIAGVYYDPSSGTSYPTLDALEGGLIMGYWYEFESTANEPDFQWDLNGNGTLTDLNVPVWHFYFRMNPVGTQIYETPGE